MIDVLKDHVIVIFDAADKVSRCAELQEAAFAAGFRWASGHNTAIMVDTIKTLHFNSSKRLVLTKNKYVETSRGQEVSIDFMINRLKEVASSGL